MNKFNSKKPKRKPFDKTILILAALVLIICLYFFLSFLYKLNLKDEWIYFILACIGYIVVFIYGVIKQIGFKNKVTNIVSILLMIFFIVVPILIGYLVFYFKVFPLPKKGHFYIYSVIGIISLSTFITCFDQSLKFLERRKRTKDDH